MAQDFVVTGPYFQQVVASAVQVLPTGETTPVTLGAVAAAAGAVPRNANGLPTNGIQLRLSELVQANGQPIPASASGTNFGLTYAAATGTTADSPAANNSTIAPVVGYELLLPGNYVTGQNITLTVNQNITIGSGTVTTKTLTAAAYALTAAGASGSNLIATAAQTLTNANTALTFVITGTGLAANTRLLLLFTGALTETSSHAVTFSLTQLTIS